MNDRELAESWAILLVAVVLYVFYIFVVGPLGVSLVLNPLGVYLEYMGRVSITFGLSLLSFSFKSSNNSD